MQYSLLVFYVLFFATGFMGLAALLLFDLRVRSRLIRPLLGFQLLFLVGMSSSSSTSTWKTCRGSHSGRFDEHPRHPEGRKCERVLDRYRDARADKPPLFHCHRHAYLRAHRPGPLSSSALLRPIPGAFREPPKPHDLRGAAKLSAVRLRVEAYKGQIAIPKAIPKRLNLRPGDVLEFDDSASALPARRVIEPLKWQSPLEEVRRPAAGATE